MRPPARARRLRASALSRRSLKTRRRRSAGPSSVADEERELQEDDFGDFFGACWSVLSSRPARSGSLCFAFICAVVMKDSWTCGRSSAERLACLMKSQVGAEQHLTPDRVHAWREAGSRCDHTATAQDRRNNGPQDGHAAGKRWLVWKRLFVSATRDADQDAEHHGPIHTRRKVMPVTRRWKTAISVTRAILVLTTTPPTTRATMAMTATPPMTRATVGNEAKRWTHTHGKCWPFFDEDPCVHDETQ